jgi:hypothetical protein
MLGAVETILSGGTAGRAAASKKSKMTRRAITT